MRQWFVIYENKEMPCSFVSVNLLKGWIFLNMNEQTFKIHLSFKKDYYDAKRGIETKAIALTRNIQKPIKIVFK